ncbi:MAG: transcriptional regulator with XRE-family HTH domain [Kiritimatiellia bacterium]|jgi:transcriptional regulator with XRE-family HTH domain
MINCKDAIAMSLSIGEQLSLAREQRQFSKTQLSRVLAAQGCKLSPRQIRALESDEAVKASLNDLKKMFDLLAVETDFIIDKKSDFSLKNQAKQSMKELARRGKEADVFSIFKDAITLI